MLYIVRIDGGHIMAQEEYQIPIFLINGQLDSGKTRFISDTIAMGQFAEAKNKLLSYVRKAKKNTARSF